LNLIQNEIVDAVLAIPVITLCTTNKNRCT